MAGQQWTLAIDFGTSNTTAAAASATELPHLVEVGGGVTMPSVVMVDGDVLVVGRAAEEMASSNPERVLRAPKRRINDRAPIVLGGRTSSVLSLIAAILAKALSDATRSQGSPPGRVVMTHPATWGESTKQRLRDSAAEAGMSTVELVAEPIAAATSYWNRGELQPDDCVAIYDLGGGTFDTAVLRSTGAGFEIIGQPRGDASTGGELFDEVTLELIESKIDPADRERLHVSDEKPWRSCAALLRREARLAKELLSDHPVRDVAVSLPTGVQTVRITHDELEARLQPLIDDSVGELGRTIADAGLRPGELKAIQLVGGSSKIPAIERSIRAAFPDVDVQRRGDPKAAVALGALGALGASMPTAVPRPGAPGTRFDPTPPITLAAAARPQGRRRAAIGVVVGVVGVVVALLAWLVPRSGEEDTAATTAPSATQPQSTNEPSLTTDSTRTESTPPTDASPGETAPSTEPTSLAPVVTLDGFICVRGTTRPEVHVQRGAVGMSVDVGGATPVSAAVSPDGTEIALIIRVDGRRQIAVVPVTGGTPIFLPFDGEAASPTWRGGTTELTFAGRVDGDWNIYSYDRGATATRALVDTSSDEDSPAWNDDGTLLAYASNRTGGSDLVYVYDALARDSAVLPGGVVVERGLTWIAGSASIVVATSLGGVAEIVEVFVDGSPVRRITTSPLVERDPTLVPGERAVVVSIGDSSGSYLQMIDLDNDSPVRVTDPGSGDSAPQALPSAIADQLVPG